ncbi:MAG: GntR family transcriptional regulator, partial [Pseudomonadota bacterium]
RDRLASGELAAGDRLPSEAELCAIWGVSRITAKRAMDLLAADGLVERARGRGTTVLHRAPAPPAAARLEGWLENLHRLADATEVELLDFGYRAAPRHVADQLRLPAGAPVQRAVRVRRLDGAAVSHLESWVPEALGRRWDAEALRSGSLLRLLEGSGVRLASARQSISAAAATPAVAAALGLSPGAALLDVRRRVLDAGGRPVEYIRTLYRPDLHRYEMELGGVAG